MAQFLQRAVAVVVECKSPSHNPGVFTCSGLIVSNRTVVTVSCVIGSCDHKCSTISVLLPSGKKVVVAGVRKLPVCVHKEIEQKLCGWNRAVDDRLVDGEDQHELAELDLGEMHTGEPLAISSSWPRVGQDMLAIGSPLGEATHGLFDGGVVRKVSSSLLVSLALCLSL
eukprot:c21270_g1_i1.p1 GENE.c21270_g1_i1~~c21270_g1_i1.p1  ORF type:complete len:185 (-),score=27.40 c21270_g1_i1:156-662(-)